MMGMTMFKEVFMEMIEYLVERIQTNYALQLIPNSFLSNSTTSATFASILLSFLLKVSCTPSGLLIPYILVNLGVGGVPKFIHSLSLSAAYG